MNSCTKDDETWLNRCLPKVSGKEIQDFVKASITAVEANCIYCQDKFFSIDSYVKSTVKRLRFVCIE